MSINCPKCNQPGATECAEEVDIGVGTIKHVWGFECEHCGQLAVCSGCGKLDCDGHAPWCDTILDGN